MRRHITPATAISLVALFFSLTGAGFAASRYIITSTSQIKPSVRAALRGHQGMAGRVGPEGPQGPVGPQAQAAGPPFIATGPSTAAGLVAPASSVAQCPSGSRLLSGGYWADHPVAATVDAPTASGWIVSVQQTSEPVEFYAVALCQRP